MPETKREGTRWPSGYAEVLKFLSECPSISDVH
jgi:hypothetical protein